MPATAAAWQAEELGPGGHATDPSGGGWGREGAGSRGGGRWRADDHPGDFGPGEGVKAAAAPDDADEAAAKNRDEQRLNVSKTFDGMAPHRRLARHRIRRRSHRRPAAFTRKRDPNLPAGDDPIGQRRADALRPLARHALNHADQNAQVAVLVAAGSCRPAGTA